MTIYKYDFEVADTVRSRMPVGAQVLCVQMQRGIPCIWALVDPKAITEERTFRVYGTGQQIEKDSVGRYIGTFQMRGGDLVFHLFDVSSSV